MLIRSSSSARLGFFPNNKRGGMLCVDEGISVSARALRVSYVLLFDAAGAVTNVKRCRPSEQIRLELGLRLCRQ